MSIETYHIPVMLEECITALNIKPDGVYVDLTMGGGGHTREILKHLGPKGHLYSLDQDPDAEANAPKDERHTFVASNFRFVRGALRLRGVERVDGILADLGVSGHHFDDETRGFSFRFDAPLDMRMNGRGGMTAADVVNKYSEEQLANIFFLFGELKNGRKLANVIVKARSQQPIVMIQDLLDIVKPLMGRDREKKDLAKVFQALRIEVNQEMKSLEKFLSGAAESLKPGGRLVVITYHSLEDRMVKNFIKSGNIDGKAEKDFYGNSTAPLKAVNRKPILPQESEIASNTRARSAKLRIAIKEEE